MNPDGKPVRNKILLSVPDTEYQVIRPHLRFLSLPHHLSLHEPHRTLKFVHFPNEGLISLVVELKEGKSVEAGLIGNEGAAGIPAVFGLSRSPLREIVQIAGSGFRVRVGTLKEILRSTPQLQMILSRFAMGLAMQVAQTAACNRLHNVEQRLARWLLIAHDRADSGDNTHHARFPCDYAGDGPTECDPGSRRFAAKADHWLYPPRLKDFEPQQTRTVRL